MPTITFNGKVYNDLAEMPAQERQAYEQLMGHFKDENNDGIPDIFQGDVVSNIVEAVASTHIVVDGQKIGGFQNLTQEQRLKLEKGMALLKKFGVISEMPNLDGGFHASHPTSAPVWGDARLKNSQPLTPSAPAIEEDTGIGRLFLVLVLVGLLLFGLSAAFYFLTG